MRKHDTDFPSLAILIKSYFPDISKPILIKATIIFFIKKCKNKTQRMKCVLNKCYVILLLLFISLFKSLFKSFYLLQY
jgi:hypothetical protein